MSPESNGEWYEYRRMVIDWHNQEVQHREEVQKKLADISQQLTEIGVERKLGKWALGGGIAGFLSLCLTIALKLAHLI